MTLPVFLVDPLPAGAEFRLDGTEGRHAATVRRLAVGERLVVTDGRGSSVAGEVIEVGSGWLRIALGERSEQRPPAPRLVAIQALPKGDRAELAVSMMVEAGVDEIVPWAASRCVVRWRGDRADRSLERWRSAAREAAKQARRTRWATISELADTATVAARLATASAGFVLHEEATEPLARVPVPTDGDAVIVIGPEGGISESEIDAFTAAGATPVRLGDTVLRTSTAGVAALAVLNTRTPRWS